MRDKNIFFHGRLYKINITKSPEDERDYIAETIYPTESDYPTNLDLRKSLLPVRNQGSQGTCVAMSCACMKEWQELKDISFKEYMSPQFIYNNRENQERAGMYGRSAMKILSTLGSCKEISFFPS